VLRHEPDLVIYYEAHNEYLEERTVGAWKGRAGLTRALAAAGELRTVRAVRAGIEVFTGPPREVRPILPAEVDALLEYRGGLERYRRGTPDPVVVEGQFAFHLERIVRSCRAAGVPVVVCDPVCNLRDTAPFKSEHRADLTPEERARFEALTAEARAATADAPWTALERYEQALTIDARFALVHWELAQLLERVERVDEAREHYLRAKEEDVCPLRVTEPLRAILRDVTARLDVPRVDVQAAFEAKCRNGIPGGPELVDHAHPSFDGNQIVAEAVFTELQRAGMVNVTAGYEERRERAFAERLASLDALYFAQAQERLGNLRRWAAGLGRKGGLPASP
jgi:hypothetical protein